MRGFGQVLGLVLMLAVPAQAEETWQRPGDAAYVETEIDDPVGDHNGRPTWPVRARLTDQTDRYTHDVLGGIPMFSRLTVTALACGDCKHASESTWSRLPDDLVFEDVAPRLWDVDGDGRPEIVVVESHVSRGARLAVWDYPTHDGPTSEMLRRAATAFIGQPQRWLAPAGIGDFDGDGRPEMAYVDRPHLARELVFVRLEGDRLTEIARAPGFSNHRIGQTQITSATLRCKGRDTLLLPDADQRRVRAVTLEGGRIASVDSGPYTGPGMTLRCPR